MAIRVNNIDNRIDNLQTMFLQHTDIQLFIFQYLRRMIDKPSEGLDKLFFGSRNVIILRGEQKNRSHEEDIHNNNGFGSCNNCLCPKQIF